MDKNLHFGYTTENIVNDMSIDASKLVSTNVNSNVVLVKRNSNVKVKKIGVSAFHASPLRGEAGQSPDEGGYK